MRNLNKEKIKHALSFLIVASAIIFSVQFIVWGSNRGWWFILTWVVFWNVIPLYNRRFTLLDDLQVEFDTWRRAWRGEY
jgi:hypothetical protein